MKQLLLLIGLLFAVRVHAGEDYATKFAGKHLLIKDANCAGITFESKEKAYLIPEMHCRPDLEVRVRWIREDLFVLIEVERVNEKCPPRTWIYEIKKLDKDQLTMHEYWTGWGVLSDSDTEYVIEDYSPE